MWLHQKFLILVALVAALHSVAHGADDVPALIAVLKSDASLHDKGVACRKLAVLGNTDSVPVLAGLLADEQLSHLARTGLEALPGPEVNQVFRDALTRVHGPALVGVINSIGNRRDSQAVAPLKEMLQHTDRSVQGAALAALGRIANDDAVAVLNAALRTPPSVGIMPVAAAALHCADLLVKEQRQDAALPLYDAVRQLSGVPAMRAAATLSAIRARGSDGLPLLREQLRSDDDRMFAVALQATRWLRNAAVTQALLEELSRQSPERQILLLAVLADLGDKQALPAVRDATGAESIPVRLAAIRALEFLGDGSVVDLLFSAARGADPTVAQAAEASLISLAGTDVDQAIVSRLAARETAGLDLVLRIAGARRIVAGVPRYWSAARSPDRPTRHAALKALGETAGSQDLDLLVNMVLQAPADERSVAVAALTSACRRAPEPDKLVSSLAARLGDGSGELQGIYFELLRTIGGGAALQQVLAGARDKRDAWQDAATRALGEWPTSDVGPELLSLSKSMTNPKYQIRALRGYIRVFRQFGLPTEERIRMAREALHLATRTEDKVLVLHALLSFQNVETLNLALESLGDPGLRATAAQVAIYITDQVSDTAAIRQAMQKILDSGAEERYTQQARDILAKLEG